MFLLVFVLRFPYHLWAIARVPLDRPPGVDLSVQADFEGRIRLVGYQIDRWVAFPGEVVHLNLWWRPLIDLQEDAHVYVHGIPADRPFAVAQVFQSDHVHPADLPTRRWDPEKHYRDAHLLRIPPDVPPGPYRIRVGWYSGPGNSRWRVEESGADGVDLPWTLIVRRAIPDLPSAISFGGYFSFAAWRSRSRFRAVIQGGEPFEMWLSWRALRPLNRNYTLFIHLVNEKGQLVAQQDRPQLTSMWPIGEDVPLRVSFPSLPSGRYRVRLGWYLWPSMEHLLVQGLSGEHVSWELPSEIQVDP